MTPTRYPGWRTVALITGAGISLVFILALIPGNLEQQQDPIYSPELLPGTMLAFAIIVAGAVTSTHRPAMGFFIFGAGFLTLSANVLFRLKWDVARVPKVASLLVYFALYTWLGVKQLSADRVSS